MMAQRRSGVRADGESDGDESDGRCNAWVEKVYHYDSQTDEIPSDEPHKEDFHEEPIRAGFLRAGF